jgi:RING-like zinc finger
VHRVRVARAAQRDRAPEDIVNNLPSRVWTGTAWEKDDPKELAPKTSPEETAQPTPVDENPSTSHGGITSEEHPWFEQQVECAICLSQFAKGDRVRVLPCQHIFHLDEVDEWLIQRKKLVSRVHTLSYIFFHLLLQCPICKADVTRSANPNPVTADGHEPREPQPSPPQPLDSTTTERTPLLQDTDHS